MIKEKVQKLTRARGGWILLLIQFVGFLLLSSKWSDSFVFLTPINLSIIVILFLLASESPKSIVFYLMPALLGWLIEVLGTNSGFPFGEYTYSGILGPGLFGTPIMIGVLWWVLIRSAYDLMAYVTSSIVIKSLLTGLAIDLNFWHWKKQIVPIENYLAWFLCSALFAGLTDKGSVKNPLSHWIWIVMILFFGAFNLID